MPVAPLHALVNMYIVVYIIKVTQYFFKNNMRGGGREGGRERGGWGGREGGREQGGWGGRV